MKKTASRAEAVLRNSDQTFAGALIKSEDTIPAIVMQALRVQRRFSLSLPTARVVAELAYQTGARS